MLLLLELAERELPDGFAHRRTNGECVQVFYCSTEALGEPQPPNLLDDYKALVARIRTIEAKALAGARTCESFRPFSGAHLVRRTAGSGEPASPPPGTTVLEEARIRDWTEVEDHPDPSEHRSLGLDATYDFASNRLSVRCAVPPIAALDLDMKTHSVEQISTAVQGDKLGGWPHWVQDMEYPNCPSCSKPMQLFFQLGSRDHVGVEFGDQGTALVMHCPGDDLFTLLWQCS